MADVRHHAARLNDTTDELNRVINDILKGSQSA